MADKQDESKLTEEKMTDQSGQGTQLDQKSSQNAQNQQNQQNPQNQQGELTVASTATDKNEVKDLPPMTKAEAAAFLGVSVNANSYQIEKAYTKKSLSTKKRIDAEALAYNRKVNQAYDVMRGYKPLSYEGEPVIAGKHKSEWKNAWEYGKYALLAGILILIILIWFITSTANNKEPDFTLGVFGEFFWQGDGSAENNFALTEMVKEQNPEINDLRFSYNLISENKELNIDPQTNYASTTKRLLMLSGADTYDMLILDTEQYKFTSESGGLYPLDNLYALLAAEHPELIGTAIVPLRYTLDDEARPEEWEKGEHIYGLRLNDQALSDLELLGSNDILAISIHSEQEQLAEQVIYNLLSSYADWRTGELPRYIQSEMNPLEPEPQTSSSAPEE